MKRILFLAAVLGLALPAAAQTSAVSREVMSAYPPSALASLMLAARPAGEFPMFLRLNGSPSKLGVIVSAGGSSTTNASTLTPFTLASGDMIDVVCDAAAVCIEGSTASTTITSSAYGVPQALGIERFWILAGTSSVTFACAGAAAFNCAVFRMQ